MDSKDETQVLVSDLTSEKLSINVDFIGHDVEGIPADIISATNQITQLPGVDKTVLLPDLHLKKKYLETEYKISVPSSAAISSSIESLYPQLRSRGIGCGMILMSTGIMIDKDNSKLPKLLKKLSGYFLDNSFELTPSDIKQMCLEGAPWICRTFGLDKKNLNSFFKGGSFLTEDQVRDFSWDGLSKKWENGQAKDGKQVGLDLTGNHFLEAQVVQESSDPGFCLYKGELVFLYHGSCNGLASIMDENLVKDLIEQPFYQEISKDDQRYDLIFKAVNVLLNFSTASRCLVIARLRKLLSKLFDDLNPDNIKCVSEAPHNTILTDRINGKEQIIYRHNAVPLTQSCPVIVSGRNDHVSYLFIPGDSAENSLNSLDHGIGAILSKYPELVEKTNDCFSYYAEKLYFRGCPIWLRRKKHPLIDENGLEDILRKQYELHNLVTKDRCVLQPLVTLKKNYVCLRSYFSK